MMAHTCNCRTWEAKEVRSEVQSLSGLHGKADAILGYMNTCTNEY